MSNKNKNQPQRSVFVRTLGSSEERTVTVPHQSRSKDEVGSDLLMKSSEEVISTTDSHLQSESAVYSEAEIQDAESPQKRATAIRAKSPAQEIATLAEYVEALYAGKIKTLSESTIKRITSRYEPLRGEEAGALFLQAQSLDLTLEKTRLLMSLSGRAAKNRTFAKAMRDFARDAVNNHPIMRGKPEGTCPFFGTSDVQPLEDFWKALFIGNTESALEISRRADSNSDGSESAQQDGSRPSQQFGKARKNAFLCAVLWRYGEGLVTFAEVLRLLKATVYHQPSSISSLETRLIDALAQPHETRETERLALVFEWFAGQSRVEVVKVIEAKVANERLSAELLEAAQALEVRSTALFESQKEVAELRGMLLAAERQLEISRTHSRADYEELRARTLAVLGGATREMGEIDIALSRPAPKAEFVREVLRSVADELIIYHRQLEEKK